MSDYIKKLTDEELNDFTQRVVVQLEPNLTQQVMSIIYELSQYRDKIKNGTLMELPCKVGQWVYVPWCWDGEQGVANVRVEEIHFYDTQMHYMFFIDMESDDRSFDQEFGGWKIDESIGKTVFLTKAEAENKLEELRGE